MKILGTASVHLITITQALAYTAICYFHRDEIGVDVIGVPFSIEVSFVLTC